MIGAGEAEEGIPQGPGQEVLPERGQWVAGEVQRGEVFARGLQPSLFSHGLMAVRHKRGTCPVSEHVKLV